MWLSATSTRMPQLWLHSTQTVTRSVASVGIGVADTEGWTSVMDIGASCSRAGRLPARARGGCTLSGSCAARLCVQLFGRRRGFLAKSRQHLGHVGEQALETFAADLVA